MSDLAPHRFSHEELEQHLRTLLDTYPDAFVNGVLPSGHYCDVPEEAGIVGHDSQVVRTALDLVDRSSRQTLIDLFARAREEGACETKVTNVNGGESTAILLDFRDRWEMFIGVWIDHDADKAVGGLDLNLPTPVPVTPRYGRVWRNEIAEAYRADVGLCRMTGYDEKSFIVTPASELLHPADAPTALENWLDIIQATPGSARRYRCRYKRVDGTWLWVEVTTTNHLDDPDEPHVLSEVVDISEEMANAEEVWRGRELLHRLTESLPVGVLQIDTERGVVHTNHRLHEILGVERHDTLLEQVASVVDDERPELERAVTDLMATGTDGDLELRAAVNGGIRYLQISLRALRDRDEAVSGAILCVTDVTDSTHLRKELEHRASYDVLTQCLNRGTFMRQVERCLADPGPGVAVVFVDLDGFKPINDRLGHAAGDELLSSVADVLRGLVRTHDVLGRLGGDEFVVLCPEVPDRARAAEIGARVAEALRFDKVIDGETVSVRASVGIAWSSNGGVSADQMVAAADAAMYEAKRTGGHEAVLAGAIP